MLVLSCFCPGRANLHDGMQSMCLMSVQACTDSKHAFVWHMSGPDAVPVHAHRLWLGGSNKHIKMKSIKWSRSFALFSLFHTSLCVFLSLFFFCLSLFSIFSSYVFLSLSLSSFSLSFPCLPPPPTHTHSRSKTLEGLYRLYRLARNQRTSKPREAEWKTMRQWRI